MHILTSPISYPSARILRDSLEEITNKHILVTSRPERVKKRLVIRYGNSFPVSPGILDTRFNSPEFIKFCSNKRAICGLISSQGSRIAVPIFLKNSPEEKDYPLIIRETLTSSGGRGIHVIRNSYEFSQHWRSYYWWTKFIKTSSEFRVHVLDGKPVRVFKKTFVEETAEEGDYPIRNLKNGYHFSLKESGNFPILQEFVNRITASFKEANIFAPFYAMDVGWMKDKKDWFLFELNSAPGLNEFTASAYASFLAEKLF